METAARKKTPSFADRDELKARVGKYLKNKFHLAELSRKDAAERAGISEGYLTTLLAGRTVLPGPEIVRNMARWWGFPVLDFYIRGTGLLNDNDVEEYIKAKGITASPMQGKQQMLNARLAALPVQRREQVVDALLNVLTTMENTTRDS